MQKPFSCDHLLTLSRALSAHIFSLIVLSQKKGEGGCLLCVYGRFLTINARAIPTATTAMMIATVEPIIVIVLSAGCIEAWVGAGVDPSLAWKYAMADDG